MKILCPAATCADTDSPTVDRQVAEVRELQTLQGVDGRFPKPDRKINIDESQRTLLLQCRKAVFVVDDDPSMLKGMCRLLRQHGYDTVPFETAKALKNHSDFGEAFCIVLDVNLGDGSGIELRYQLAERGVALPVIYITGNDSHATRMAAMDSGCMAYLTKPFAARSLVEPVARAAALA